MAIPSKFSASEIEEAFKNEAPYFYELQRQVELTESGVISVQVRKHKGKVTDYVVTVANRFMVK